MKLPPLRALQCFEAVARLNSFSKAAEHLNVTQSAVSHQVRLLEDYLGETLFNRQGRSFSLTKVGERYFEEVTNSLGNLSNDQMIRHGKSGNLRLALYNTVAVNWLIPKLEDFRYRHPEIEITLNMVGDQPDYNDQFADCFITTNPPERNFVNQFMFTEKLYPVCGKKQRQLRNKLYLIHYGNTRYYQYNTQIQMKVLVTTGYVGIGGKFELPKDVKINQFSHLLLAAEAARYNLGITLINNYMMDDQDRQQSLVRIPMHELITGDNFYFVYKETRARQPDIMKLGRWLKQQCYELESA